MRTIGFFNYMAGRTGERKDYYKTRRAPAKKGEILELVNRCKGGETYRVFKKNNELFAFTKVGGQYTVRPWPPALSQIGRCLTKAQERYRYRRTRKR